MITNLKLLRLIKILFLFVLISKDAIGQVEPKSNIIPSQYDNEAFQEKLVEMALLNFPEYLIEEENAIISKYKLKLSSFSWLDQLSVSGNLNEYAINPPEGALNTFYPRYNFGMVLPLGVFVRRKTEYKIAQEQLKISQLSVERAQMTIRKEVLTVYNNYLLSESIFKIKNETAEEAYTMLTTMEDKFENGEVSLLQYNASSKAYKLELESRMTAKTNMDNIKLELEMWIGTKLENVN